MRVPPCQSSAARATLATARSISFIPRRGTTLSFVPNKNARARRSPRNKAATQCANIREYADIDPDMSAMTTGAAVLTTRLARNKRNASPFVRIAVFAVRRKSVLPRGEGRRRRVCSGGISGRMFCKTFAAADHSSAFIFSKSLPRKTSFALAVNCAHASRSFSFSRRRASAFIAANNRGEICSCLCSPFAACGRGAAMPPRAASRCQNK